MNPISLHRFHACSKAVKQHRFTPSSHASLSDLKESPSFIAARQPKSRASGVKPVIHLCTHTALGLNTSCLGITPVGRLSVIPLCAQTYLVNICGFICLSIFGLIPRSAIALQGYLEMSCPKDKAKWAAILFSEAESFFGRRLSKEHFCEIIFISVHSFRSMGESTQIPES